MYDAILYCQHFSEPDAMSVTRQLGLAQAYLHANSIVHRGIKPENIFVSKEDLLHLSSAATTFPMTSCNLSYDIPQPFL